MKYGVHLPVRMDMGTAAVNEAYRLAACAQSAGVNRILICPCREDRPLSEAAAHATKQIIRHVWDFGMDVVLDTADITKKNYNDPVRLTLRDRSAEPEVEVSAQNVILPSAANRWRAFFVYRCEADTLYQFRFTASRACDLVWRRAGDDSRRVIYAQNLAAGEHRIDLPAVGAAGEWDVVLLCQPHESITGGQLWRSGHAIPPEGWIGKFPYTDGISPRWENPETVQKMTDHQGEIVRAFGQHPNVVGCYIGGNECRCAGHGRLFSDTFVCAGQGFAHIVGRLSANLQSVAAVTTAGQLHAMRTYVFGDMPFTENRYAILGNDSRGGAFTRTELWLDPAWPVTYFLWAGTLTAVKCEAWLRESAAFDCAPWMQIDRPEQNAAWREGYRRCQRMPHEVWYGGGWGNLTAWTTETLKTAIALWQS